MGNKKVVIFLLLIFLVSCAPVYWELKKSLREPGEKLLVHPDKVWQEYSCAQKRRPFAQIVKYEILPPELYPGEELNQHFEYVFCPARPAQVLAGTLYRRIYFKGKIIFEDKTPNFELKPGKWAVDAFIRVPPEAKAGVYFLEVLFKAPGLTLKEGHNFVVKAKQ